MSIHGRLVPIEPESRELTLGLSKDRNGESKVSIDGNDGHKIAELAKL